MILATKAKESADKMESMTKRMHQVAIKTQQETVSMKVITVVTLIFLPGTFVSVSSGFLACGLVTLR
jgi:Mg2+ and Co2+ transporter CorA